MAEFILRQAAERNRREREDRAPVMREPCPPVAAKHILRHLDFRTRTRFVKGVMQL